MVKTLGMITAGLIAMALMVGCEDSGPVGSTGSGNTGGKTEMVTFASEDGTRRCEAWKEGNSYEAFASPARGLRCSFARQSEAALWVSMPSAMMGR
jgi:hypothetical protein